MNMWKMQTWSTMAGLSNILSKYKSIKKVEQTAHTVVSSYHVLSEIKRESLRVWMFMF